MAWMIREDKLDSDQRDFINVESKKEGNIWVKGFAGSGKSILLVHSLKYILNNEPQATVAIVVYTHSLIDMFKTGMKELNIPVTVPVMTYYEFVDKNTSYDYVFCDEVQDLPDKVLSAMQKRAKKVIVAGDSNQSIYEEDPKWREPVVKPEQVGNIINARPFTLNMIHRLTKNIITAVQKLFPSMNIWGAKQDTTKQNVDIRLCEASNEREEVKYVYQEALKGVNVGEISVVLIPNHDVVISLVNTILEVNNKPIWTKIEKTSYFISTDIKNKESVENLLTRKKVAKKDKNNIIYFGYYFDKGSCETDIAKLQSRGIQCALIEESWGPKYDLMNSHLKQNGIKLQFIGNGHGSLKEAEQNKEIILMTYHSSKGLDFDNVFLPFLNNNFYLHPRNAETVFMVAMTRSRKNLYLTYYGYTHNLLDKFKNDCIKISISDILNPKTTTINNEPNLFLLRSIPTVLKCRSIY